MAAPLTTAGTDSQGPSAQRADALPASELKYVTLLRSDLVGSTDMVADLGPEAALTRLEPALDAMRAAVRAHGGIVCQELGDGLLAAFGAPVARDDHATAGVYAALDLLARIAALGPASGFQVRVGVHTGWVVARTIRTEYSSTYDMSGPAPAFVERLQAAAEAGSVLVSDACRALTQGHVAYTRLPLRALKGFGAPVPLHRADKVEDVSNWRVRAVRGTAEFVGRTGEIDSLQACAADVVAGARHIVELVGEPGIGKSRLAHEFLARLERENWRAIQAEAGAVSRSAPYALLKTLVEALLEHAPAGAEGDDADAQSPLARSAIDAVRGRPVASADWAAAQPAFRRSAITHACHTLLRNASAGRPTAVLIEDAHWMDQASAEILDMLLAAGATLPCLLIFTTRPAGAPAWLERQATMRLALAPLDDSAADALLRTLLPASRATAALRARILRHTGSVPLFMEEVCKSLLDGAAPEPSAGTRDDRHEFGVPPTVQGVLAARIDQLEPSARRLLQLAAAIGANGSVDLLRTLAGGDDLTLLHDMDALHASGLLRETGGRAGSTFAFAHDLVRQVAYESMLEAARVRIHGEILAAMEADAAAQKEDRSSLLCHHAHRARAWRKTIDYARSVARTCIARSALADASDKYRLAIEAIDALAPSTEREQEAIDLRIESRTAFSGSGRVDLWLGLAKQAEERAAAIGDKPRRVAAMAVRSAALNFYGTAHEAVAAGAASLAQAEALGDAGWINYTQYGMGQAYFIAGRFRDAARVFALTYRQLTSPQAKAIPGTNVKEMLILAVMMRTMVHAALGELDVAARCWREADALATATGRPFDRVAAGYAGGVYLLARADARRARVLLATARALAETHGIKLFLSVIECQLGIALHEQGDFVAARQVLARAHAHAGTVGHVSGSLRAGAHLALALAMAGKAAAGLRRARRVRRLAWTEGFAGICTEALLFEAQILATFAARDRRGAAKQLRRCISLARKGGAAPIVARARALLAPA